jgi:thioredoxin reductase
MISNITKQQAENFLGFKFKDFNFDLHWTDYEDTYYVVNLLRNRNTILELGTYLGHTAKNIVLNTDCKHFITIDIVKELHSKVPKFQGHELLSINDSGIKIPNIDTIDIEKVHTTTDDFFNNNILKFDGIFIDASHDKEDVLKDSLNALESCRDRGIIVWHDVYNFDNSCPKCQAEPPNRGVVDALNELPFTIYKIEKSWVAFCIV